MAIWSRPTVDFSVYGPIAVADLPGLRDRLATRLSEREAPAVILCHLVDVQPDAVAVDALTQLTLCARRRDCRLRVLSPSADLVQLIEMVGLEDVLER